MTAVEDPPYDPRFDEPDEHRNGRAPKRPAAYDTDAERALLGAMAHSVDACDTVIATGLQADDFHAPLHGQLYIAAIATLNAGEIPDPVTIASRTNDPATNGPLLLTMQIQCPSTRNAWSYARRILACAHARRIQGHALEIANAAQNGDLDEALRRLTQLTDDLPTEEATSTWAPIDLDTILNGTTTGPEPTICHVDGAPALFYAGRTNAIFGESGAGKTWIGLAAIVEAITAGHDAAIIDLEDTAAGLIARLLTLGCTPDQIRRHFIYIQPDTAWSPTAQAELARVITTRNPTVVLIDSTGEAMATDGVKGNDDDDVARWFSTFPKFIARHGPAVILTDHIPKATDAPQLYQIGSQRKRAAIDGASYRIDALKEPSRTSDGVLTVTTAKDRHGHHTKGKRAAEVRITHETAGEAITMTINAPQAAPTDADGKFRPTIVMERVSELLEREPGLSGRQIESRVPGKAKVIREATRLLIVEGYIDQDPAIRGFAYRSSKPFRADDDTPTDIEQDGASDDI